MASRQRGSLVAGVDIGGTFTDVVLLEEETRTVHASRSSRAARPERGGRPRPAPHPGAAAARPGSGGPRRPCHDPVHQCADRAARRGRGPRDDAGLSRHDRDRTRTQVRAVRPAPGDAAPAVPARAPLRGEGAYRCRRARRRRARRVGLAGGRARGTALGGGEPGPVLPELVRQPAERTRRPGHPAPRLPAASRVRVLGSGQRDPRVRPLLHRRRQRVHPAAGGTLPARLRAVGAGQGIRAPVY